MTCHQIIVKLFVYRLQLVNLLSLSEHAGFDIQMTNEYSFITFEATKSDETFIKVRFELTDEAGTLLSVHCEDSSAQEAFTEKIAQATWQGWRSYPVIDLRYPNEVLESIQTADGIASFTRNCARGDDYRPGNFSKVNVATDRIELEQINHMNARSVDHKNNYSLRDLKFTIPLDSKPLGKSVGQKFYIGNMMVEFSDRSSQNNRACGDKVVAELERLSAE
jgi:hypothetical protein